MLTEEDLHSYQETAAEHIVKNPFCGLFMEMGLGKTISTLTAVARLLEDLDVTRVLVIAPKRVAESVWSMEVSEWKHTKDLTVSKIAGNEKQRLLALKKDADLYTIGRDNVSWLCGLYGGSMLPFDMCIIDESSSFKNHASIRFKSLKKVQPCFKRVVILTGTPAPNGLIDLWSQIYLLDRGERLGRFITRYRQDYFNRSYSGYGYEIRKGAEKMIHNQISDICMSMKAEDYLELPERVDNVIPIEFPGALQSKYNKFEKERVLELLESQNEGEEISALNAAALSNKLLQFANGALYDENKKAHPIHNLKLDAVEEIIESAGGNPVLIAWTYRSDMLRLKERLKRHKPRELKTEQDIRDWNKGKIHILLMHPASGGHGLNLQKGGNIIVWFGQTWSLELDQQFNARLHRQGQTKSVVVNRLVACDTIEQDVLKALKRKAEGQDGLMEAVKTRINKYLKR